MIFVKKTYSIIAMVVSVLIVLFGVLTLAGALGGDTSYPSSAPWSYDTGYATFGGDFYTYVSNNAGEAASASRTAASNLDEIATLLKSFCGISLSGFGLLSFCFFGTILAEEKRREALNLQFAAKAAAEQAEEETAAEEAVCEEIFTEATVEMEETEETEELPPVEPAQYDEAIVAEDPQ